MKHYSIKLLSDVRQNNIVLSLSGSGAASALLHPNGRIQQYGSRVEIFAHDIHGNNKYAKIKQYIAFS